MEKVITNVHAGAVLFKIIYISLIAMLASGISDLDYPIAFAIVSLLDFGATLLRLQKLKKAEEIAQETSAELNNAVEIANSNYEKWKAASENLAEIERKLSDLEANHKNLQSLKESLEGEVNSLLDENKSLKSEVKRLFLDCQNLQSAALKLQNAESSLKEENRTLKEENRTLKEQFKSLHQDFDLLKEENRSLREENRSLNAARSAYEGVKRRYLEQIEHLKGQLGLV